MSIQLIALSHSLLVSDAQAQAAWIFALRAKIILGSQQLGLRLRPNKKNKLNCIAV